MKRGRVGGGIHREPGQEQVGPVSRAARSSLSTVSLSPEPATKLAVRISPGR